MTATERFNNHQSQLQKTHKHEPLTLGQLRPGAPRDSDRKTNSRRIRLACSYPDASHLYCVLSSPSPGTAFFQSSINVCCSIYIFNMYIFIYISFFMYICIFRRSVSAKISSLRFENFLYSSVFFFSSFCFSYFRLLFRRVIYFCVLIRYNCCCDQGKCC